MESTRKNNTKQLVTWPTTSYFTIKDVMNMNTHIKPITLRKKMTTEIESTKVVLIGSMTGGKGAPLKVFAFTPVSKSTLDLAILNKINLVDNVNRMVNVVSVSTPKIGITKSPAVSNII